MLSRDARETLLDSSPLCHFAQHGLLGALCEYLGERARITREVEPELQRLSGQPEFQQLRQHVTVDGAVVRERGKWPKHTG